MKTQKEFENILNAIDKWVAKNNGEVTFVGVFVSFDKKKIRENANDIVKDSRIIAYGNKGEITVSLEELSKMVKKEKKDFINW